MTCFLHRGSCLASALRLILLDSLPLSSLCHCPAKRGTWQRTLSKANTSMYWGQRIGVHHLRTTYTLVSNYTLFRVLSELGELLNALHDLHAAVRSINITP